MDPPRQKASAEVAEIEVMAEIAEIEASAEVAEIEAKAEIAEIAEYLNKLVAGTIARGLLTAR